MTTLSAAQRSQIYTELEQATSPMTAEAIMHGTVDVSWEDLVTKDHLDARLARIEANMSLMATRDQLDERLEARISRATANLVTTDQLNSTIDRALRKQTIWFVSTMLAFNGLLAAWFSAFH